MQESTEAITRVSSIQISQSHGLLKEGARKAFHSLVLSLPIGYHVLKVPLEVVILVFLLILTLFIPIEIIRLKFPGFFLNRVVRKSEEDKIANYVPTTMVWCGLTIGAYWGFYPFEYAEAAIIATVIGDAAAALAGKSFGTRRLVFTERKTVEGAVVGFLVTWIISSSFLAFTEINFAPFLGLGIALVFLLTDLRENPPTDLLCDNILNPILGTMIATLLAEALMML
ncbi:MAG: diacylglycerol/polyprenol kinase family protein [Candidatus Hodarchaeota archaeon]